jgi:AbiV family abortive infection protein
LNRNLAILGATKCLENAHALLDDSKLLSKGKRYGTSYALAIFALEEIGKAFVFHWVADGVLTQADLRKLIYHHRSKHAIIQLTDTFEKATPIFMHKLRPILNGKSTSVSLDLDEAISMMKTAFREASQDHVHLLIHAQQRREISLYVDICRKCDQELLGPWAITALDVDELTGHVQRHLAKMESFIRNCKRHGRDEVSDSTFGPVVMHTVKSLERAARTECQHVLCSNVSHRPRMKAK